MEIEIQLSNSDQSALEKETSYFGSLPHSRIISAFPGCGKSYVSEHFERVSDSDSSKFDKSEFPENYIRHIKTAVTDTRFVMVSSHDNVRQAMLDNGLNFTLVYPTIEQKAVYVERYTQRGSPAGFIELMNNNWDKFIASCETQLGCRHIQLQPGQYLADVITRIENSAPTFDYTVTVPDDFDYAQKFIIWASKPTLATSAYDRLTGEPIDTRRYVSYTAGVAFKYPDEQFEENDIVIVNDGRVCLYGKHPIIVVNDDTKTISLYPV